MLGGYQTYLSARLVSLLRQGRLADVVRLVRNSPMSHGPGGWRVWLRTVDFLLPPNLQAPLRRCIGEELMPRWLNAKWFRDRDVNSSTSLNYTKGKDVLRQTLSHTLTDVSLPALLRYEDRNSMASSIESRVPFLTPALVNFVLGLPEEYLIAPDGTTKAVFRRAMRGIVPDAVLDRPDKIGFVTPEKRWLTALRPWVERLLSSQTARQISAIDADRMVAEWNDIVANRRRFDSRVWRWLNTILWVQKFALDVD